MTLTDYFICGLSVVAFVYGMAIGSKRLPQPWAKYCDWACLTLLVTCFLAGVGVTGWIILGLIRDGNGKVVLAVGLMALIVLLHGFTKEERTRTCTTSRIWRP